MTFITPLLIIFELDFTLCPLWISNSAPFTLKNGVIKDSIDYTCKYYFEVPEIFEKLKERDIKIAIASCNLLGDANQIISLFNWDKYISFKEIFPANNKTYHLKNIHSKSKIPFDKMILFDQEILHIKTGRKLGIFSVLVDYNGMSMKVLENGLKEYELREQERLQNMNEMKFKKNK